MTAAAGWGRGPTPTLNRFYLPAVSRAMSDLTGRTMLYEVSGEGVRESRGGRIASNDHPLRAWDEGEGEYPWGVSLSQAVRLCGPPPPPIPSYSQ